MENNQPKQLSPEEQQKMREDFLKRSKEIDEKVKYLCDRYKVHLGAMPVITGDGRIMAQPIWHDAIQQQKVEPKSDLAEA